MEEGCDKSEARFESLNVQMASWTSPYFTDGGESRIRHRKNINKNHQYESSKVNIIIDIRQSIQ